MAADPRILLLGAGGFVGTHLRAALVARFGGDAQIIATTLGPQDAGLTALDMRDAEAMRAAIRQHRPTHVVNLAGLAAPVEAARRPELAWDLHALAPERLGRIVLQEQPDCWVLHVSSGLIYGRTALGVDVLTEGAVLAPMDIYATTKAAGDLVMGALAEEGLKSLRLRPFNHTGPGQSEAFVVPAFAAQIAMIRAGTQPPVIRVGNLEALRDFLDVRDVVDAYVRLIAHTPACPAGGIYNIASGQAVRTGEILDRLIAMSGMEIRIEPDPARQRPSDLPRIAGSSAALQAVTGWAPTRTLDQTLRETLAYFEGR